MFDNYFDASNPMKAYTHSFKVLIGTFPASNAIRHEKEPTIKKGYWPCLKASGDGFEYVEDHRGETRYSTKPETLGMEIKVDKLGTLAEVAPDTTDKPMPTEAPEGKRVVWADTDWGFAPLTPEQQTAKIIDRLSEIDRLTIRPLRAISSGTSTQTDVDKLEALTNEASALREQLAELSRS